MNGNGCMSVAVADKKHTTVYVKRLITELIS